jgi:hypothetical protein
MHGFLVQGRDHTIFSLIEGRVKFSRDPRTKRRFIGVEPLEQLAVQQQRLCSSLAASGSAGALGPQ